MSLTHLSHLVQMQETQNNINNLLHQLNSLVPGGVNAFGEPLLQQFQHTMPPSPLPSGFGSPLGWEMESPAMQQQFERMIAQQQAMHMSPKSPLHHRVALGELPLNNQHAVENLSLADSIKALIERERAHRQQLQRVEITESARLEMNLQNVNIKRNSQKALEAGGSPKTPGHRVGCLPEEHPGSGARTCEREENADGSIKYEFASGLPGGVCVYFLKGFCGLGNKCRYVHDSTDPGNIVKITGMPFNSSAQQVISFFAPLELQEKDVTFLLSREAKPTGSAFVEFRSRKDALFALGKDRNFINEHRFVLLYPSSKIERAWFMANPLPHGTHPPSSGKKVPLATPPAVAAHVGSAPPFSPHLLEYPHSYQVPLSQKQQHQNAIAAAAAAMGLPPSLALQMIQNHQNSRPHPTTPPLGQRRDESEQRITPVKLQFDESDEGMAMPRAEGACLLSDLSSKLRTSSPALLLAQLPDENMLSVLKSMGYSSEHCSSIAAEVRRVTAPDRGLPPLVPMTRTA